MGCAHPLYLPRPGLSQSPYRTLHNGFEFQRDYVVAPCGKCMYCLRRKQNDLAVRLSAEAQKRGTMHFVTLTYDDEHIPLTSTLFRLDTDTGELERLTDPEFFASSSVHDRLALRERFAGVPGSPSPRYFDFDIPGLSAFEPGIRYFYRVTPSVCREDVRLWIKRCRVSYFREFGEPLPEFTYCFIQEYGPRTCRPHVHAAFFGLSQKTVEYFSGNWNFGYTSVKEVKRLNPDGSSGFNASARYIGKYMSKGVFECSSVKDCLAQKPRVCSSKHLGVDIVERIRPYVLAFDLFGKYDPDTLRFEDSHSLSRLQIDKLCEEIPKRLSFSVDGVHYYALPRVFRKLIFYKNECIKNLPSSLQYESVSYSSEVESFSDCSPGAKFSLLPALSLSAPSRPYRIWSLVSDRIRTQFEVAHRREFFEFFRSHPEWSRSEVAFKFEELRSSTEDLKESSRRKDLQLFYSKSVF